MNKIKIFPIFILSLVVCLLLFAGSVFAVEQVDSDQTSYLFYLYYDNGQLYVDRDFEFKYDILPEEYIQEFINSEFPFRGEIINFKNEIAFNFLFDPKRGDIKFKNGKIKIKASYVADGQKAVFYDPQGKQLLTIFVSESSFCNDDGVCDPEKGEDDKTCRNDCAEASPEIAPEQVASSNQGMSGVMFIMLAVLTAGLVVAGGWYAWRKWYKSKHVDDKEFTNKLG